jgi:DNA-binding transcriptional MerR regulator
VSDKDLLKIGELAKRAGKTVRALHLYEELELLTPAQRSAGGFRLYDDENVERIRFIDRLQKLGLSLAEIRTTLSDWNESGTGLEAMQRLEAVYRAKLAEVRAQMRELAELEGELLASLTYIEGCRGCGAEEEPLAACTTCDRTAAAEDDEHLLLITGLASH